VTVLQPREGTVEGASDQAPSGLPLETPTGQENLQDAVATLAESVTAGLSLDDAKPASEETPSAAAPLVQLLQLCNQSVRTNPSTCDVHLSVEKLFTSPPLLTWTSSLPGKPRYRNKRDYPQVRPGSSV
jgi:hypothetical protein